MFSPGADQQSVWHFYASNSALCEANQHWEVNNASMVGDCSRSGAFHARAWSETGGGLRLGIRIRIRRLRLLRAGLVWLLRLLPTGICLCLLLSTILRFRPAGVGLGRSAVGLAALVEIFAYRAVRWS